MTDLAPTPVQNRVFLSAEWRYLVMLNYAVDPAILRPYLPPGTELDLHRGACLASMVGFRFLRTKLLGLPVPFHRDFDEVNLRFYVRQRAPEGWRRGVVFVRELVPRRAIAFVARVFYGEPYLAVPMRHSLRHDEQGVSARYEWQRGGEWEYLEAQAEGAAQEIVAGSEEEFITEHYWGYTAHRGRCSEYQVEHPQWRVWPATTARLQANVATLYDPQFVESLTARPTSAFIAEGSPVLVRVKSFLPPL